MDKLTIFGIAVVATVSILLGITILEDDTMQSREVPACNLEPRDPPPNVEGISWNFDECYYFLDDPNIPYNSEIYFLDKFREQPCSSFEVMIEYKVISPKTRAYDVRQIECFNEDFEDVDKILGGPGNRHPSFLGFYVDSHCTDEMIQFMQKYTTMFERGTPLMVEWVGLPDTINEWEYHSCFEGTKAKRGEDTRTNNSSWQKDLEDDFEADYTIDVTEKFD